MKRILTRIRDSLSFAHKNPYFSAGVSIDRLATRPKHHLIPVKIQHKDLYDLILALQNAVKCLNPFKFGSKLLEAVPKMQ